MASHRAIWGTRQELIFRLLCSSFYLYTQILLALRIHRVQGRGERSICPKKRGKKVKRRNIYTFVKVTESRRKRQGQEAAYTLIFIVVLGKWKMWKCQNFSGVKKLLEGELSQEEWKCGDQTKIEWQECNQTLVYWCTVHTRTSRTNFSTTRGVPWKTRMKL